MVVTSLSIYKISRDRHFQITSSEKLRPGQIIQGKINKIYLNNNAQIQVNNKVMIAQLEAPLAVGERYYFQVESTSDAQIQLRVLSQELKSNSLANIQDLMSHIGIRPTKLIAEFLHSLINEQIPFEKKQLRFSIEMLHQVKDKEVAQQILKYMISESLPMSHSTFHAFYTLRTKQLSLYLNDLIQQISATPNRTYLEHQLLNRMNSIIGNTTDQTQTFIEQINYEIKENSQQIFNLFRLAGIIDVESYSLWEAEWEKFFHSNAVNKNYSHNHLPFQIDFEETMNVFQAIKSSQNELKQSARVSLNRWVQIINDMSNQRGLLTDDEFTLFKEELNQKLSPFFIKFNTSSPFQHIEHNRSQLVTALNVLQMLSSDQTYDQIENLLTQFQSPELNAKSIFLSHLNRTLLLAGLSKENLIASDQFNQAESSVKSLLLQYIQQNESSTTERAQQLLHVINGLQLQSIQETDHFIYASLQLPGERLQLNKDLQLDFESKKTKEGKINPDYCRIIFYLDLNSIKETIIDMHIQNRYVTITVFNDEKKLINYCTLLQPKLKKGLKELKYELSSISVKPISDVNPRTQKEKTIQQSPNVYEGIDYRI